MCPGLLQSHRALSVRQLLTWRALLSGHRKKTHQLPKHHSRTRNRAHFRMTCQSVTDPLITHQQPDLLRLLKCFSNVMLVRVSSPEESRRVAASTGGPPAADSLTSHVTTTSLGVRLRWWLYLLLRWTPPARLWHRCQPCSHPRRRRDVVKEGWAQPFCWQTNTSQRRKFHQGVVGFGYTPCQLDMTPTGLCWCLIIKRKILHHNSASPPNRSLMDSLTYRHVPWKSVSVWGLFYCQIINSASRWRRPLCPLTVSQWFHLVLNEILSIMQRCKDWLIRESIPRTPCAASRG